MGHDTIVILFWISLIVGMTLGIFLCIWWIRKILTRLNCSIERDIKKTNVASVNAISMKALIYALPGLFLLVVCCIPSIYFSGLMQRERHCMSIIKVNPGIKRDSPFVIERCHNIDVDALFKLHEQGNLS